MAMRVRIVCHADMQDAQQQERDSHHVVPHRSDTQTVALRFTGLPLLFFFLGMDMTQMFVEVPDYAMIAEIKLYSYGYEEIPSTVAPSCS